MNLTISVDDSLVHAARVRAAQQRATAALDALYAAADAALSTRVAQESAPRPWTRADAYDEPRFR